MDGSQRSFTATVRRCLRSPAALGYLALVAGVVGWIVVDQLFVEHPDADFAGVWAFVVTAPTSWLFLLLPGPLPWAGLAVGALLQAAVLGAVHRRFSDRVHHRTRQSGA